MRRWIVSCIVLVGVSLAGLQMMPAAEAFTAPVSPGLAPAIQQGNLVENIQYVCRRVRRCGPNGCFWRRVCSGGGPGYYEGYGRGYQGGYQGGYRTWNGCPPNFTVQDGACRPYRGF
jgi:hypothetical protein